MVWPRQGAKEKIFMDWPWGGDGLRVGMKLTARGGAEWWQFVSACKGGKAQRKMKLPVHTPREEISDERCLTRLISTGFMRLKSYHSDFAGGLDRIASSGLGRIEAIGGARMIDVGGALAGDPLNEAFSTEAVNLACMHACLLGCAVISKCSKKDMKPPLGSILSCF